MLTRMKVHFKDLSGSTTTQTCVAYKEGEHGLYLFGSAKEKMRNQIGYVPYERLDYVEPEESAEQEAE